MIPTIPKKQTKNSFLQNNFFYIERLHKLKYQKPKPSLINKSSGISYIPEFPQKHPCLSPLFLFLYLTLTGNLTLFDIWVTEAPVVESTFLIYLVLACNRSIFNIWIKEILILSKTYIKHSFLNQFYDMR